MLFFSQSNGIEIIRKHVSEYITNRDGGIASDPENIILSGGASESIRVSFGSFRLLDRVL